MDNLEDMERFLEKFNLPRLNQEEIESMNNTIASTEIEAVIKNLPKNKYHGIWSITSWQIDGEIMETVTDFIFLGCRW